MKQYLLGLVLIIGITLVGCGKEQVEIPSVESIIVEPMDVSEEEAEEIAKEVIVSLLKAYEEEDQQGIVDVDMRTAGTTHEKLDELTDQLSEISHYILRHVQVLEVTNNEIQGVFGYEYDYDGEHYKSVNYYSVVKVGEGYMLLGSEPFQTDEASFEAFAKEGLERWETDNLLEN